MPEIKILKDPIMLGELKKMAADYFGDMVKAVADVEQGVIALNAEFYADLEVKLMEDIGAKRENTWGFNFYPEESGEKFIEFDSMINYKAAAGNKSRYVESQDIRRKIEELVAKFIVK